MTEKEKMLKGLLYDANCDEELLKEREACKELCYDFNQLRPSQVEEQTALIKRLFGKTKEHFTITAPFWCDYGYNIEIGENFYTNHNCVILDGAKVVFGDNVWIGGGVQVMPGVTIGSDTVIGAGSLVNKDIPSGVLAAGNPCRVIRKLTEEDRKKYWK
ncbi:MAG TPA: sugar O-acetyltransferase [Candidatus Scybalocola faecigallinarum]|uniref:Acetyltransferase n=1 Tax=Candidatus Scybalocola faecigallinarum TaxID=2840941 RepID=A0A9D1F796_9FIRM|nr:sugar O-acetyltransferase [Candidatus Scybalocola faecigallinarum]